MSFQYQDLAAEDEFRLLKLKAGQEDDYLVCSLHHFVLGSGTCPPYRALSYTWDKDEPRHEIRMPHGSAFKVRENPRNALLSLRDAKSDCWVWIDAICINQLSDAERGHQVKLMATIYGNANVVIAWLESTGEFADVEEAFEIIHAAPTHNASNSSFED